MVPVDFAVSPVLSPIWGRPGGGVRENECGWITINWLLGAITGTVYQADEWRSLCAVYTQTLRLLGQFNEAARSEAAAGYASGVVGNWPPGPFTWDLLELAFQHAGTQLQTINSAALQALGISTWLGRVSN